MNRGWYAVTQGWRWRHRLAEFLKDPAIQIHTLSDITPERLYAYEVRILALDFDGVLGSHDQTILTKEVEVWLRQLTVHIGELSIVLLTNKPKPERLRYFHDHFPLIHVVQGVRKKPFPDGLLEIAAYKNVRPHQIVLVDDRLLTGMLATCVAYCRGWYFYPPIKNYRYRPFQECWFAFLRKAERLFFGWF